MSHETRTNTTELYSGRETMSPTRKRIVELLTATAPEFTSDDPGVFAETQAEAAGYALLVAQREMVFYRHRATAALDSAASIRDEVVKGVDGLVHHLQSSVDEQLENFGRTGQGLDSLWGILAANVQPIVEFCRSAKDSIENVLEIGDAERSARRAVPLIEIAYGGRAVDVNGSRAASTSDIEASSGGDNNKHEQSSLTDDELHVLGYDIERTATFVDGCEPGELGYAIANAETDYRKAQRLHVLIEQAREAVGSIVDSNQEQGVYDALKQLAGYIRQCQDEGASWTDDDRQKQAELIGELFGKVIEELRRPTKRLQSVELAAHGI